MYRQVSVEMNRVCRVSGAHSQDTFEAGGVKSASEETACCQL